MSFLPEYPELTPKMRSVLERMARVRRQPLHLQTPQQARAAYEGSADVLEVPRRPLGRIENVDLPARDGQHLPARIYQADDRSRGVLLYLHGGGFTIGSVDTHDILCRELAGLAGCAVVSLGYRLRAGTPLPGGGGGHLGRVAVAGSPARGARLARRRAARRGRRQRRRHAGRGGGAARARPRPAAWRCNCCSTPGTAPRQDSESHRRYHQGLVLEQAHIEYFFGHYIALDTATTGASRR